MIQKASKTEIQTFVVNHPTWKIKDKKLSKTFVFKDFTQAFAFMTAVASVAEHHQHHPEWFNVYKTVSAQLTTHEANGITKRDFELADAMDNIVARQLTNA